MYNRSINYQTPASRPIRTRSLVALLLCLLIIAAVIVITILRSYYWGKNESRERQLLLFDEADINNTFGDRSFLETDYNFTYLTIGVCLILIVLVFLWGANVLKCDFCCPNCIINDDDLEPLPSPVKLQTLSQFPIPLVRYNEGLPPRIPRAFTRRNLLRSPSQRSAMQPYYRPRTWNRSTQTTDELFPFPRVPTLGYVYPPNREQHPCRLDAPGCSYSYEERMKTRMCVTFMKKPTFPIVRKDIYFDREKLAYAFPVPPPRPPKNFPISPLAKEIEVKVDIEESNIDKIKHADEVDANIINDVELTKQVDITSRVVDNDSKRNELVSEIFNMDDINKLTEEISIIPLVDNDNRPYDIFGMLSNIGNDSEYIEEVGIISRDVGHGKELKKMVDEILRDDDNGSELTELISVIPQDVDNDGELNKEVGFISQEVENVNKLTELVGVTLRDVENDSETTNEVGFISRDVENVSKLAEKVDILSQDVDNDNELTGLVGVTLRDVENDSETTNEVGLISRDVDNVSKLAEKVGILSQDVDNDNELTGLVGVTSRDVDNDSEITNEVGLISRDVDNGSKLAELIGATSRDVDKSYKFTEDVGKIAQHNDDVETAETFCIKTKFVDEIPEALVIEKTEDGPCSTFIYDVKGKIRYETHFPVTKEELNDLNE